MKNINYFIEIVAISLLISLGLNIIVAVGFFSDYLTSRQKERESKK